MNSLQKERFDLISYILMHIEGESGRYFIDDFSLGMMPEHLLGCEDNNKGAQISINLNHCHCHY